MVFEALPRSHSKLQLTPREDFDRRIGSGSAEGEVKVKIKSALAVERPSHDGTRNLGSSAGPQIGIRGVNQAIKNSAAIEREAKAARKGKNRELGSGGPDESGSKGDRWRAYVEVEPGSRSKHNLI